MDIRLMQDDTPDLEAFFPYRLAIAAENFSRNLLDVYGREFGLSREEWRLIYLLAREEQITSLELSNRTTLDRVQVSRASQRLEDKGLITRSVAPEDRRLKLYACTDQGRALFQAIFPKVQARTKEVLDRMTPEGRTALNDGLKALSDAMDERPV